MAGLSMSIQLPPPPQQIVRLDEYLMRQYMNNLPQLPTLHQRVCPVNTPAPEQGYTTPPITTHSGVNRRRIFKQKCRRYVAPPHPEVLTEMQTKKLPLPKVLSRFDNNLVLNTVSQAAITPQVTAELKSHPKTPTVPKNVSVPPVACLTPNLQVKEMRSAKVTSTPNTVGRRHIFKKKCNRYVPKALQQEEVITDLKLVRNNKYEDDDNKPSETTTKPKSFQPISYKGKQGLVPQNRPHIGNAPEKQNTPEIPNFEVKSQPREANLNSKVEDIITEACEKISVGATTQTIAHLNDEFEKLIHTLRRKGYDLEDKQRSNKKATSPNTAIPDLPEPATIKYPVEPAKIKREQLVKKSHYDHLKPSNKQRQKCLSDKKVPIGMGYARVPARLLKNMNWKSYSNCTRKLMTAVFPRRILATHSLTGKASPAFPDKPAKKMLDPMLVNDIIITVMDKCDVSESQVRMCVTTKCADESKMLRTHEQKTFNRRENHKENYPPSSATDDDSLYGASD